MRLLGLWKPSPEYCHLNYDFVFKERILNLVLLPRNAPDTQSEVPLY